MTIEQVASPKPSDERNGCFLDKMWCCKVCDGEIPDGHTPWCDIWKLEKKHRDFIATEYNSVLMERDRLQALLRLSVRYECRWCGSRDTMPIVETP